MIVAHFQKVLLVGINFKDIRIVSSLFFIFLSKTTAGVQSNKNTTCEHTAFILLTFSFANWI